RGAVNAVPPVAGAERHVLGLPGQKDRGAVRDREGALSRRADAPGQRRPGKLSDVAVRRTSDAAHAASRRALSGAGRLTARANVALSNVALSNEAMSNEAMSNKAMTQHVSRRLVWLAICGLPALLWGQPPLITAQPSSQSQPQPQQPSQPPISARARALHQD